jgi:pyruvate/2-oxoglutarate dehydrogenase complex dihydrolipoamide dehydrogenase (E3) component
VAEVIRRADAYGIKSPTDPVVDFGQVMERVRKLRAQLSWSDSAARAAGLGVDVFFGDAAFQDAHTVVVDGARLVGKHIVIATGTRAMVPALSGLTEAGFLTNENVFELTALPPRLAVIGGGPLGCELAQAFQRLGSQVTVFQQTARLLDREDAEAAQSVQHVLAAEGVQCVLSASLQEVVRHGAETSLRYRVGDREHSVTVDTILLGTGRVPNVEGLNLEAAGVAYRQGFGVTVNEYLQTSQLHIYAAGDICSSLRFTHAAESMARTVVRNALFPGRQRWRSESIPRCTYTDPEIAQVGATEAELKESSQPYRAITRTWDELDRAVIEGQTQGFVKALMEPKTERLLGVTLVGAGVGNLMGEAALAFRKGMRLSELAEVIHPYPTRGDILRQTALAHVRTRLTPGLKTWFTRWLRWTR